MFRSLLRFTGDDAAGSSFLPPPPSSSSSASSSAPPPALNSQAEAAEALSRFLAPALSRPDLRDELYAQLVKQTRGNPSPGSSVRTWRLLAALASVAPPSSPALLPLVADYLGAVASAAPAAEGGGEGRDSFSSRYAAAAISALQRTSRAGARRHAPGLAAASSWSLTAGEKESGGSGNSSGGSDSCCCEVAALLSLCPLRIRVRLLAAVGPQQQRGKKSALSLSLALHPAATVLEAVEAAAEALALDNYKTFSLFVSRPPAAAAAAATAGEAGVTSMARKRSRASRWKRKHQRQSRLGAAAAVETDSDDSAAAAADEVEIEGASDDGVGVGVGDEEEGPASISSSSSTSSTLPTPRSTTAPISLTS